MRKLFLVVFVFLIALAITGSALAQEGVTTYPAYDLEGGRLPAYDVTRTLGSGWLGQKTLPPEGQREAFVVSLTIDVGEYFFSGVSCSLLLDSAREGDGGENREIVAARGNGLEFEVETVDNGEAWAVVTCDDGGANDVVGFSITRVGEVAPPDDNDGNKGPAAPEATQTAVIVVVTATPLPDDEGGDGGSLNPTSQPTPEPTSTPQAPGPVDDGDDDEANWLTPFWLGLPVWVWLLVAALLVIGFILTRALLGGEKGVGGEDDS